jgi:hypothetical protein
MTFKFSVKPFFKTPKRLAKTPRLTIQQIAKRVTNETRLKSRKVGVEDAYEGRTPKFLDGYTTYKFITRNTANGHRYKTTVYSPTPKVTSDTKVIIDSPCPVDVFKYEYALAKRGNAYIYRTNGDAPIRTNPKLIPGCSHHVYRIFQYLIRNTGKKGLK